jgi:uncharacterized protein (TIGR02147 family)
MLWQTILSDKVRESFVRAKSRNPRTSLRSFSKRIQTPVSTVSEILGGKLSIGPDRATEILKRLGVSKEEENLFLVYLKKDIPEYRHKVPESDYGLLLDWKVMAILHCFELDPPETDAKKVSNRLGFPEEYVEKVIHRLVETAVLEVSVTGDTVKTGRKWRTTDNIPSDAIRNYHQDNLDLAKQALKEIPVGERDFTSTTFVMNESKMNEVREEIRQFHKRISALAQGSPPKTKVCRLTVALHPLEKLTT